jgi:hypothetical protein
MQESAFNDANRKRHRRGSGYRPQYDIAAPPLEMAVAIPGDNLRQISNERPRQTKLLSAELKAINADALPHWSVACS